MGHDREHPLDSDNHSGSISDAQHGSRSGAGLHVAATAGANGFMSAADKTKIDKVQGGDVTNEPHGFLNRTDSTISFVDGSRTFSITPVGASYDIFIKGVRYAKAALESVVITNTTGLWYFYFNAAGVLTASQTPWDLLTHVPIAYVYWDATNGLSHTFGEERHGVVMDSMTHEYLHRTVGTSFWDGLALTGTIVGDGTADAHAQVAVADGDVYDEDLLVAIRNAAVPVPPFQQILSPIAQIPVYYRFGNVLWRKQPTTSFPVFISGADLRIRYNQYSAPNWLATVATTDGNFVAVWILATNNVSEPVIAILGQREDTTLYDAQVNNTYQSLVLTGLPVAECKLLYRLIFQTSSTYVNAVHARLREILDNRAVMNAPAGTYVPPPSTLYGSEYSFSQVVAETSFTGTTVWQNHLQHTTGILPPGRYIIRWSFNWSYSVTNRNMSKQVLVDGTTVVSGPLTEGLVVAYPAGYASGSGSYMLDLTGQAPATHTIAIQGLAGGAADTQYMKNKIIEVHRVS